MNFGQRLRDLRLAKHMTQEELGQIMNVGKASISLYEKNDRTPDQQTLIKTADYFGVSLDYLLGRSDSRSESHSPQPELVIADDSIKVYGEIHAGEAAWADQNIIGKVPTTKKQVMRYGRKNLFGLKIVGESMNKRLLPGYTAVFCKDKRPEPGDVVAVLIDHEDATVKVYQETSLAVMFEPDSYDPTFKPYVFRKDGPQDFEILGVYLFSTDQEI